jgi:ubiquinone/menaquinone biosynthesis C-methylase UbiE
MGSAKEGSIEVTTANSGAMPRAAYIDGAQLYDSRTRVYQGYRRQLVDRLPLSRGDVVLDVGCGTGLCLPMLAERVTTEGTVVGIDESPQMLEQAERRVADQGWRNVRLVESRIEDVALSSGADAAVFCAVHDVLQSPRALERVFEHLRPGAWVAATGGKWAPWWMGWLNAFTFALHQPYVRTFDGFDRPWRRMEQFVDHIRVVDQLSGYVAWGQVRGRPACPTLSAVR